MQLKLFTKKSGGFTLVELLAVVAIIGILLMLAVPKFGEVTRSTQRRSLQNNVRTVVSAVLLFQADNNGAYPTTIDDLDSAPDNMKSGYTGGTPVGPGTGAVYSVDAAPAADGTYEIHGSATINGVLDECDYDMNTNEFTNSWDTP